MADAVLRQWQLLRHIPIQPQKIDAGTLAEKLSRDGVTVSRRTVQRDLQSLSAVFPLVADERGVTFGWSWTRESPTFDLPAINATAALSLAMIEQFLQTVVPPETRRSLEPQFKRARRVLEQLEPTGLGAWTERVRIVGQGMPLIAPDVPAQIADDVQRAVLDRRQLNVDYRSRSSGELVRDCRVHPLGLVVRGPVTYLIATLWDYDDVRQLAVHRIARAALRDDQALARPEFSLDEYVRTGGLEFAVGETIEFVGLFERPATAHLEETPLSVDQVIEDVDDEHVRVRATVRHTKQLEWWLLGFGSQVVVEAPTSIVERLRDEVRQLAQAYGVQPHQQGDFMRDPASSRHSR